MITALLVFVLTWVGSALGAPPVPGPAEGFIISTSTDIECIGTVRESSSYNSTTYAGDGPLAPATGGGYNSGSEVAYKSDFRAIDGFTRFVKEFSADSNTAPNLESSTAIGYEADPSSPAALATFEEKVGISVVSAGQNGLNFSGLLSLCPWATSFGSGATNTSVAAGSKFNVTSINNFTSEAEATTTDVPSLSYAVNAFDREGGFAGVGDIAASMVVEIFESGEAFDGTTTPPLQSRTSFEESASASGVWNFSKEMDWGSRFTGIGSGNPFTQVP
jgi:hypothetical protein